MAYPIIDIEITEPLPAISISDEDTGIAVLLRRRGKPVDFLLEALPANRELKLTQLVQQINQKASANKGVESSCHDRVIPAHQPHFPPLTIAICTKDRPEYLARCLEFLQNIKTDKNESPPCIEILVVDNASSDSRTMEVVKLWPDVRYVREPRLGLNFARNRALEEAKGQLLAYLDDDVVVDSGWLLGLMKAWSQNPEAAAYTGLVLPYELVSDAQILFEQRGGFRRGFQAMSYGQTLPGHSLYPLVPSIFGTGANMAFKKDILQKLGGFDEALDTGGSLPGGGDLDMFYRIIRAGYSLHYQPNYLVFHQHRRETKALRRQYWSWGVSYMAFVVKSYQSDPAYRPKVRRVVAWWFARQLWELQRSLIGRHPLPSSMILAELWGGIMGFLGGYSRSQRRVERIRRRVPSSAIH